MIELPPLGALGTSLWHVLLDLRKATDGWTLVGGQMVLLHGLEHETAPARISVDIDLIADVRARPRRMPLIVAALAAAGFVIGEPDPDGYAHRYSRERIVVDLLVPDHAGPRADARTNDSTVSTPVSGGTYALQRSADIEVVVDGRIGLVPLPDLAGAILIKARAAVIDRRRGPDRHYRDLAFLDADSAHSCRTISCGARGHPWHVRAARCRRLRRIRVAIGRSGAETVALVHRRQEGNVLRRFVVLGLIVTMAAVAAQAVGASSDRRQAATIKINTVDKSGKSPKIKLQVNVFVLGFVVDVNPKSVGTPPSPGSGHWHIYVDGKYSNFSIDPFKGFTVANLKSGHTYKILAQLVNNDHTPLKPPIISNAILVKT